MSELTQELATLYNQKLCQIDQIRDLQEKLRKSEVQLRELVREISQLIESAAANSRGTDSSPPALTRSQETGGGFQLRAVTPRAVSIVDALDRVLGKLPHGGSL
jgi:hypothetical protein